jgi:hypothetical protein
MGVGNFSNPDEFKAACVGALSAGGATSPTFPTEERIRGVVERMRAAYDVTDQEADQCVAWLEARLGVSMTLGSVLETEEFEPWLRSSRADIDWFYWQRYKDMSLHDGQLPPKVIDAMDMVTDRILDHCENPRKEGQWDRRGMVVGHVQSGKTANYTGLICKAADAGFRLIVVIAGVHNRLRNQTQERVDAGFVGIDSSRFLERDQNRKYVGVGTIDSSRRPTSFTSSKSDFNRNLASSLGISIGNSTEPVIFVIKKNSSVLENLLEWLRDHNTGAADQRIDLPMLLIDDEADNASINIAYGKDEVSRINGQLRRLLQLFERSTYVGYTATPFANIFIDPDSDEDMYESDLFPRDFIVSLDPPSNYCGPDRMFLDAPDEFIENIDDCEEDIPLSHKIDHDVSALPESLKEAVRGFVLARAIRILRGDGQQHMSMLVNVSRFRVIQGQVKELLFREVRDLEAHIRVECQKNEQEALKNPSIRALASTWESLGYAALEFTWEELQGELLRSVASIEVVAINSSSSDSIDYEANKSSGLSVIAVGGFALSRGLTLEGLMVSYFYRRSLMYDTLMQMGRWFGYRVGYEDLCRVWMSEEAQGWYEHITESVDLLRQELKAMESAGSSPKDFGLKVRSHPDSLLITARNKIGTGETVPVEVGLGDHMIETATLDASPAAVDRNWSAARRLVDDIAGLDGVNWSDQDTPGFLARNVPPDVIINFLKGFSNHPASLLTETEPVIRYIDARRSGALDSWDVLVVSRKGWKGEVPNSDLGLSIYPQERTAGSASRDTTIRVTDKQRVASRGIEKVGVDPESVGIAEAEYRRAREEEGRPLEGSSNYPDRIYRSVRDKPLFLLHILNIVTPIGPKEIEGFRAPDKALVAWGISFPKPPPGCSERRVQYLVNANWLREQAKMDFEDEELVEDEG